MLGEEWNRRLQDDTVTVQPQIVSLRKIKGDASAVGKTIMTPLETLWSQPFKKIFYKICERQLSFEDQSERGASTIRKVAG